MTNHKPSTTSPIIQHVPFHEDQLSVLVDERTGKEYVLPKPMAEMLGLKWPPQRAKLLRNELFKKGSSVIELPSAGGMQETTLLERRLVHAWLLSIDINRIAPEQRAKLLRYQEECADVLDAYFAKGIAVNPRGSITPKTPGEMFELQAQMYALQVAVNKEYGQRLTTIEEQVHALQERQSPEGRLNVHQYLRTYSKPYLPREVLDVLKHYCRKRETPIMFRPDGFDNAFPYYTLETLNYAYAEATRQLSFLGGKRA